MMNKKIITVATVAMLAASASPVFATGLGLSTRMAANASSTKVSINITSAITKADTAITARITDLNNLEARIGQMDRVSAAEKTSLDTTIQASISDMTSLKAKIDADTDAATLKADIASITKSYRIYVLVMPQGRIIAAADRVVTITGTLTTLSGALQTRITAAQTAGQNVTALTASLADMNAKVTDANTQAQAAVSEIASLQPDNGDKTVFASNEAALKDARAKIKTATADLMAARKDAGSIVKALEAMKITTSASATTTAQ